MRKLLSLLLMMCIAVGMTSIAYATETQNGISIDAILETETGEIVPLNTHTEIRVLKQSEARGTFSNPVYAITTYATTEEAYGFDYDPYMGEVGAYATIYYQNIPLSLDKKFISVEGGWAPAGWELTGKSVEYGFGLRGEFKYPGGNTFNYPVNKEGRPPQVQISADITGLGIFKLKVKAGN